MSEKEKEKLPEEEEEAKHDEKKEQAPNEVKQVIVIPYDGYSTMLQDNVNDQFRTFISYVESKIKDSKEKMSESVCIFAVNHLQNRFVTMEMSVEVANLFEILQVRNMQDFDQSIDRLKGDSESALIMREFSECTAKWDAFLDEIDATIDEKIGPSSNVVPVNDYRSPYAYLVADSPCEVYLISIIRTFTAPEVTQHILALYNKMEEIRSLGCEAHLLTRGPSIGARGGSYLKLIGVPFRKICDENQAQTELRAHRRRAKRIAGWSTLLSTVELTIGDESRSKSQQSNKKDGDNTSEAAVFFASQQGCLVVDRPGRVYYKYVEDEETGQRDWPSVDTLIEEIKKVSKSGNLSHDTKTAQPNGAANGKADKEKSSGEEPKEKECCVIL